MLITSRSGDMVELARMLQWRIVPTETQPMVFLIRSVVEVM